MVLAPRVVIVAMVHDPDAPLLSISGSKKIPDRARHGVLHAVRSIITAPSRGGFLLSRLRPPVVHADERLCRRGHSLRRVAVGLTAVP